MEKIILDFTDCNYLSEVYREIKKAFHFPENYGENLDALWDWLEDYCEEPLNITVKGMAALAEKDDDWKNYILKMKDVFDDLHKMKPNIVFHYVS